MSPSSLAELRGRAPPSLPRTSADLATWGVFADALQDAGDPLGELMALDLALGPSPSASARSGFHAVAQRQCRRWRNYEVGWCLGFVRTVRTLTNVHTKFIWPADGFRDLAELLGDPRGARLEALSFPLSPRALDARFFRRVLHRLPATCEHIELSSGTLDAIEPLLRLLPPTVRSVRLPRAPSVAGLDELATASVTWDLRGLAPRLRADELRAVVRALGRERVLFAGPDDAALMQREDGRLVLLERAPLDRLQRWFGIISARAQVERLVPESFQRVGEGVAFAHGRGPATLVRHPDDTWTVARDSDGAVVGLDHRGAVDSITRVDPGDSIEIDGHEWALIDGPVQARWLDTLA